MRPKFEVLEQELTELKARIKSAETEFKIAQRFTNRFLKKCQEKGIKAVCIGVVNGICPESETFPFGPSSSVFSDDVCVDRWPAIWKVVEEVGLKSSCGNHNQSQTDLSHLIEGAYKFKDGKWFKVD